MRCTTLPIGPVAGLAGMSLAWMAAATASLGRAAEKTVVVGDPAPHVVIVVGTPHYSPEKSMPILARRLRQHGLRTTVLLPHGNPERNQNGVGLPGLEILERADAAVFYLRFLELPEEQLGHIARYVESGRPVVGLRTSTHAFAYPNGHHSAKWNDGFGRDVLGTKYFIHLQGKTSVRVIQEARGHEILRGVDARFTVPGTLYKVELPPDAAPLLMGTGRSRRVGRVTNAFGVHDLKREMSWPVAWTWKNRWGGRVFATTLGHADSMRIEPVSRLLVNGVQWVLTSPLAKKSGTARSGEPGSVRPERN